MMNKEKKDEYEEELGRKESRIIWKKKEEKDKEKKDKEEKEQYE